MRTPAIKPENILTSKNASNPHRYPSCVIHHFVERCVGALRRAHKGCLSAGSLVSLKGSMLLLLSRIA